LEEERAVTIDVVEHPATFSPTMISDYVRFFTKKDGIVLDPFVGIGSTLVACMRAGRKGIGIDISEKYVEIARKRVAEDPRQRVIYGDAWEIEKCDLPKIDYCITSPPYFRMLEKIDVTQKKRMQAGLETDYGDVPIPAKDVDDYVSKLVDLFSKVADITKDGGYLTVILQNFRDKERVSPLAWKFAMALETTGKWVFKGERIWCQDHKSLHPFGYPADWVPNIHHHYCLIFRKAKK
jgi:tRNA G10  N-methylase Trm11